MKSVSAAVIVALALSVQGRGGGGGRGFDPMKGAAIQACITQYPTAQNEFMTFASSGSTTSNDLKCYMRCMMQARGMMAADGTIAPMQVPVDPTTMANIQPCFSLAAASDPCETAYQHNKCLWEKEPTRSFLKPLMPRMGGMGGMGGGRGGGGGMWGGGMGRMGAMQNGAMLNGAMPSSIMPGAGTTPSGALPGGAMPSSLSPGGPIMPSSTTPATAG